MKNIPVALLMSDTHLRLDNINLVTNIFKQALDYCVKNKIRRIFHLGDFFHTREAQPLEIDDAARKIFRDVEQSGIEIYIIPGNHDKVSYESEKSYLDEFERYVGVRLIRKYLHFPFIHYSWNFIPYFKESNTYSKYLKECLDNIKTDKGKHYLFTHIAVSGVKNNDGSIVENNISPKAFDIFEKVFVGHYHNQSKVGKNIFYIGSTHQANFGEDNEKGFTVFYEDGSHEFIKSKFPEFMKFKIDVKDVKSLKTIEEKHSNSENNVRLILTGKKEDLESFKKNKLKEKGIDVKFESDEINTNIDISNQEMMSFDRKNIKESFLKFCAINEYEDTQDGVEYLDQLK